MLDGSNKNPDCNLCRLYNFNFEACQIMERGTYTQVLKLSICANFFFFKDGDYHTYTPMWYPHSGQLQCCVRQCILSSSTSIGCYGDVNHRSSQTLRIWLQIYENFRLWLVAKLKTVCPSVIFDCCGSPHFSHCCQFSSWAKLYSALKRVTPHTV